MNQTNRIARSRRIAATVLLAILVAPAVTGPVFAAAPLAARADNKATDALRDAISEGSAEKITAALEAGADINAVDDEGKSALMRGAALGRTDLVELLAQKGAEVNLRDKNGRTALHYVLAGAEVAAPAKKKKRGFGAFVQQATDFGGKALTLISQAGPLAQFLPGGPLLQTLAQGLACKDAWSGALGNALLAGSGAPTTVFGALDTLHGGSASASALTTILSAAHTKNPQTLGSLSNLGKDAAPAEQALWSSYLAAVQTGDSNAIAQLTAEPEFASVLAKATKKMDTAANQLPGRDGGVGIVQVLIQHGADLAATDKDGKTALARAKEAKLDAIVALLTPAPAAEED